MVEGKGDFENRRGWAGGDAGAVLRSATGRPGTPWEAVRPLPPPVTQVVALAWGEDGTLWAGGYAGQGRGALYSSGDEGESWHLRLFLQLLLHADRSVYSINSTVESC